MARPRRDLPPEGLWVSPEGDRIPVVEHLITIQHHPEKFDLSESDVKGASVPQLREIAEDLILDGWIRYRHFGDSHNFELASVEDQLDAVEDVLTHPGIHEEERVFISQARPRKEFVATVGDVFDKTVTRFERNPSANRWRFT